jgi:hypothetical protein
MTQTLNSFHPRHYLLNGRLCVGTSMGASLRMFKNCHVRHPERLRHLTTAARAKPVSDHPRAPTQMTFALDLDAQLVTLTYCDISAVLTAKCDQFASPTVIRDGGKLRAGFQIPWKHIAGAKLLSLFG